MKRFHVSKNLSSVSSLSSIRWAAKNDDLLAIINNLDVGTYTLSYSISLTVRDDTTDASLYGFRIFVDTTPIVNAMLSWGTSVVGDVKQGTATITITQANKGTFTGVYFYGCGMNQTGASGSADFTNIMLNTGDTALPYDPPGNTWQTKSPLKRTTATDTLTSFPATVIPDGTNASADIIGNMVQSGTPTSSSPIQPSETGDKTGNLFDFSSAEEGYGIDASGNIVLKAGRITTTTPIDVSDLSTVFITWVASSNSIRYIYATFSNGALVERVANKYVNTTIDVSSADQLYICFYADTDISKSDFTSIMLNEGSTTLPYEPYGYKIPISSANTTTPIYLGEVQSTRRIRKVVFDGTENWNFAGAGTQYAKATLPISSEGTAISTHFVYGSANTAGQFDFYGVNIRFNSYGIADSDIEWKSYLAQQYTVGTPVTVWYVLETPETGIVNEPIRKIGDYVDEVSGITIPTITGKDTFDVNTTLKPSEVDLTYHGWHRTEPKERVNGDWE